MTNKNHTVTISGNEYVEYLELKENKQILDYQNRSQFEDLHHKLKQEKENKTITVTLTKCYEYSSTGMRTNESYNVHVSSLDSVRQTKFLSEKIQDLISPFSCMNDKLKEKVRLLNHKVTTQEEEIKRLKFALKRFNNFNLFQRIFYTRKHHNVSKKY